MWLSTLPRRFGIILEKILDRHNRSGIAVQWNVGGGGGWLHIKSSGQLQYPGNIQCSLLRPFYLYGCCISTDQYNLTEHKFYRS